MAGTRRSLQAAVEATWGMVGSERGRTKELEGESDGLGRSDPRSDRAKGFDPSQTRPIGPAIWASSARSTWVTAQLIS
jgi:hypothetical protein